MVSGPDRDNTRMAYLLPHHAQEIERLWKQHGYFKAQTDDQLLIPKVIAAKGRLRVLDSGCADGHWLRDLRNHYPGHQLELYGIDIEFSLFPPRAGSDTDIVLRKHNAVHSIPSSWKWDNSFHVVHQRLLTWAIPESDWPTVIENFKAVLKPGGFLQLVEVEWVPQGPIHDSHPMCQKQAIVQRFFSKRFSKNIDIAYGLESLLCEGGFAEVEMVQYDLSYGAHALKPEHRELSAEISTGVFRDLATKMGDGGIPGVARTPDEFHLFLDDLKDEVQRLGYTVKMNFAVGKKPES